MRKCSMVKWILLVVLCLAFAAQCAQPVKPTVSVRIR